MLSSVVTQHSGPFFYFLSLFVIVFISMTFIMYEFYSDLDQFDSILDCFNVIIAIMYADNLKEIFEFLNDTFGRIFVYFTLILFNLTFLQVILGIVTVGF